MGKFISPGNIEGKLLRKRNKFLAIIRKHPGISRQKCAILLGLSTFNITKLAAQLITAGMIVEDASLSAPGSEKRSIPLRLSPDYEYFAGIDLEALSWRFIILDFAGNLVFSIEKNFYPCQDREQYIKILGEYLAGAIKECGKLWDKVAALGVGAPGYTDSKSGVIINYEVLPDFSMIPLRDICREISQKQVYLANNIGCLAIFDLRKRPAAEKMTVMHVAIRSGISMSLSSNGILFQGGHGRAGELGVSFAPDGATFLQDICGLAALKKNNPDLPESFWEGGEEAVFQQLKKKNVRDAMERVVKILAISLSSSAALFDPDEIIIYGPLFSEENLLWKNLKEAFDACQKKQKLPPVPLIRALDSKFNAAAGAAFFAMESACPTAPHSSGA